MNSRIPGLLTVVVLVFHCLVPFGNTTCLHPDCSRLRRLRQRKQQERKEELAQYTANYPITRDTTAIMSLTFFELVDNLQSRRLRATDALRAHIAKSVNVTTEFNCVTNFYPRAMEIAAQLDASPFPKGPLHGVPFCVKDDTDLAGMDTTIGFSKNLYMPAAENSVFVQSLLDLGAVPFCKTNIPQGHLGAPGSDNPVFGQTSNSLNKRLSPGGSSSGTGCLVGAGAVKFATASDVAGSGRIPAHFHGVSGISLTTGRLSDRGVRSYVEAPLLKLTPGFIADRPETIATLFNLVLQNELIRQYDPSPSKVPWQPQLFQPQRALRIGYFTSMFAFPPLGDTEQTILKAAEGLRLRGHVVESLQDFVEKDDLFRIVIDLALASNGEPLNSFIRGDRIAPSLYVYIGLNRFPTWLFRILLRSSLVPARLKDTIRSRLQDQSGIQKDIQDVSRIRDNLLAEMDRRSLDLILCPVFPSAAPLKNLAPLFFAGISYSFIWNVINFPAGTVRFGYESGKNIPNYDTERDPVLWLAKTTLPASVGMPIGVQLVGRSYQDELVLHGLMELELAKYQVQNKPPPYF